MNQSGYEVPRSQSGYDLIVWHVGRLREGSRFGPYGTQAEAEKAGQESVDFSPRTTRYLVVKHNERPVFLDGDQT